MKRLLKNTRELGWFLLLFLYFLPAGMNNIHAQEPPPRPVRIFPTAQVLSFGAFSVMTTGGSVTIDPSGNRSNSGNIILLGLGHSYSAALFEVHANPGTVISILKGPDVYLAGAPAGSMRLHVGDTSPGSPFVSNVNYNTAIPLYVGGTLTVGPPVDNPPGTYFGTFNITLVRE